MSKELELIANIIRAVDGSHTMGAGELAAHVVSVLSEHGYSIIGPGSVVYERVSETFTDDEGVLRDSQNGDIVSTFEWPTLHSVPVGVTRIASQSGRVAAFNQVVGWLWTDGEGFPEQDSYDGPWCVASEVKP